MATTTYTKDDRKGMEQFDKAKDTANEGLDKAKEVGKDVASTTKSMASNVVEKARDLGAEVVDKAKDAVTAAGDMATSAATAVGQKADDLTSAAGHGIRGFGDTIARNTPHEGVTGTATQAIAQGIRESGRYLEEAKLSGMAHDIENFIKAHPVPSLLICFGVGFCVGRAMKE